MVMDVLHVHGSVVHHLAEGRWREGGREGGKEGGRENKE